MKDKISVELKDLLLFFPLPQTTLGATAHDFIN